MLKRTVLFAAVTAVLGVAHPMGNFSVNHYARFQPAPGGVRIHYVLDLAEIPTFELFQQWGEGVDPQRKAEAQARSWAAGLQILLNGKAVAPRLEKASITLAEGAGNMPVARIAADLMVESEGGTLM